jgi:hypothetical protein
MTNPRFVVHSGLGWLAIHKGKALWVLDRTAADTFPSRRYARKRAKRVTQAVIQTQRQKP